MKRVMILVFAMLLFLVAGCQQNDSTKEESAQSNDDTKYEDYVYQKYDLDVNEKVKDRGCSAENSFVLAFDIHAHGVINGWKKYYRYCRKSILIVESLLCWATTGAFQSDSLLLLSHVDYYIEKNKPDQLYDVQLRMAKEAQNEIREQKKCRVNSERLWNRYQYRRIGKE